jgi:hypothetical protein
MIRFESLTRAARRVNLDTEKNIARAARDLQEAMAQRERLTGQLQKLGEAMLQMQSRQESAVTTLAEQALEVQKRVASLSKHMDDFRALGAKASEVGQALRDLGAESTSHSNGAVAQEALTPQDIDLRFRQLLEDAKALLESARAEDFPDVASETDALQQRLHALRPRLAELLRAQGAVQS